MLKGLTGTKKKRNQNQIDGWNMHKIIDIGCGLEKLPGAIGIDYNAGDIHHDLNKFPYPLEDNSFDVVYSRHCLEHLDNPEKVIEELYRICKPGGMLDIIVPYFAGYNAHHPTHRTFWNYHSFDIWCPQKDSNRWVPHINARFEIIKILHHFYPYRVKTKYTEAEKIIFWLPQLFADRFPLLYQRVFSNLIPAYEIRFVLRTIK